MTFIDVRRRSFLSGEIMNAAQIRQLVAAALRGKTDAEDRIYLTEAWPITTYPAILLQTPLEVKESIGRNAPQFNTITTLRISGHIQLSEGENPVTVAASALERLCEQIQRAVINSYELTRQIQQFAKVRTTMGIYTAPSITATRSEPSLAEVKVELDLEYYQGPEDFFPLETTQLAGIDVTINMPDGAPEPLIAITLSE
ncbi:ATP-binding protein [Yersinia pseudotuberculosis]|uniref:Putative ATP-binding protein n=1 Tax=Yersinia pseudotuberculosis TaxID=633 RepID=A0A380Q6K4_YERPU|nr:ATP-binding protein [Yersinia pseudotuberculosis]PSH22267.1 ATP-binding protein [Yersinia pseudotuberculosis]SUP81406.1 putative ATP-binding protein [Yersinia pseudotuberculosis]